MLKQVLFLCSGNYYRSRFAEILFNHLATQSDLPWRAGSRGLTVYPHNGNIGPLSIFARRGLESRSVPIDARQAFPRQVQERDLQAADLVVAVKEKEHRPMLQEKYPSWVNRIHYWHIDDVGDKPPEIALAQLDNEVRDLITQLGLDGEG